MNNSKNSKNTRVILTSCRAWNCVTTAISSGMDISEVPGSHLLQQMHLSEGHKNYFKDWCLMNWQPVFLFSIYFLTQRIMIILTKECKPDNIESHNSRKLSFANIQGLCLNFTECESLFEWNSPDVLALCETILYDSIDSGNISVRGYLPLSWKNSDTYMNGFAVYVMGGLPFLLLVFLTGFTSFSILPLVLLSITFFIFLHDCDEILLINPSANVLVFEDFNIHQKDWVTSSGETDRPGELCCNFWSQVTLLDG